MDHLGKEDDRDLNHEVFKLILPNGEEYVLNLAGAQHGHFDAVIPFSDYIHSCVRSMVMKRGTNSIFDLFGTTKGRHLKDAGNDKSGGASVIRLNDSASKILPFLVGVFVEKIGPIQALLKLPQKSFEERSKTLAEYINISLQKTWLDGVKKEGAALTARIISGEIKLQGAQSSLIVEDMKKRAIGSGKETSSSPSVNHSALIAEGRKIAHFHQQSFALPPQPRSSEPEVVTQATRTETENMF